MVDGITIGRFVYSTRFRDGRQDPSCLDLVLTDKEEIIEDLKIGDKLGASDHASIIFDIICGFQTSVWKEVRHFSVQCILTETT